MKDITSAALRVLLGNAVLTDVGLAEGTTTAATYKTTAAATYCIDGVFYSKAATDHVAFTAGHNTLLDGYSCIFAVALDAAGTFKTFQGVPFVAEGTKYRGQIVKRNAAGSIYYEQAADLVEKTCRFAPDVPATHAVVGYIKVATSGANFVPGTTDLGAGTVTDTYTDVSVPPANTNL